MSAKYQRVKQADLALPAPLRWLTRAFSSITLAVILLSLVVIYGVIASIPALFLLLVGLYLAAVLLTVGPAAIMIWLMARRGGHLPRRFRILSSLVLLGLGVGAAFLGCMAAYQWVSHNEGLQVYRATELFQLPYFEMTEQQFYAWWPMQMLLILFVINMVWATIRRIEFKFVNIGVLTVHSGIVTLAVGAMIYGHYKLEGDMILFRQDIDSRYQSAFYDSTVPALYVWSEHGDLMMPLRTLPRWNDYPLGSLNLQLDDRPGFKKTLGPRLRMSIPGFVSYGTLQTRWVAKKIAYSQAEPDEQRKTSGEKSALEQPAFPAAVASSTSSPLLELQVGDADHSSGQTFATLLANVPARRVAETPAWAIEYLVNPGKQRIEDFHAQFDGQYGLIVEVPGKQFHQVYAIKPGQIIKAGDTGYTLTIGEIGTYPIPFITPGYKDAKDTRATIQVQGPEGKTFKRIAFYRYPERDQDFVENAGDVNGGAPSEKDMSAKADTPGISMGSMGQRTAPDPAIRLVFLDATKPQFHLVADSATDTRYRLLARLSGKQTLDATLIEHRFPLGKLNGKHIWVYLGEHIAHAVQEAQPVITPRLDRQPKQEGDYTRSLVPVLLEMTLPDKPDLNESSSEGPDESTTNQPSTRTFAARSSRLRSGLETLQNDSHARVWRKLIWLHPMRYPMYPDQVHKPVKVNIPTIGPVQIAFSRERHLLPFAVRLKKFKMDPIPGSTIPHDFISTLEIVNLNSQGFMAGSPHVFTTQLNDPVIYHAASGPLDLRRVKISQQGWDPGDKSDPNHNAKDDQGRYLNQQRFSILGIANNMGIHVIFAGGCLVALGIPWAFYLKPWLVQRKKRKIQEQMAKAGKKADVPASPENPGREPTVPSPQPI